MVERPGEDEETEKGQRNHGEIMGDHRKGKPCFYETAEGAVVEKIEEGVVRKEVAINGSGHGARREDRTPALALTKGLFCH